jgi:hypothetical protein
MLVDNGRSKKIMIACGKSLPSETHTEINLLFLSSKHYLPKLGDNYWYKKY